MPMMMLISSNGSWKCLRERLSYRLLMLCKKQAKIYYHKKLEACDET